MTSLTEQQVREIREQAARLRMISLQVTATAPVKFDDLTALCDMALDSLSRRAADAAVVDAALEEAALACEAEWGGGYAAAIRALKSKASP